MEMRDAFVIVTLLVAYALLRLGLPLPQWLRKRIGITGGLEAEKLFPEVRKRKMRSEEK